MKKIILCCFAVGLLVTAANAQDNPIRIGLKFGVPNIIGLNGEYATPALGGRLAPSLDFSYFSLSLGGAKASFSYFSLGADVYVKPNARGAYANLSYGRIGLSAKYTDPIYGSGKGTIGINLLNIKVGAKLGKSFYFRPEIGWAVLLGGDTFKVTYNNANYVEQKTAPGLLAGFTLNLGFGVAF